jgi:hypothetical protein
MSRAAAWTGGNPSSQGYCLPDQQLHELRLAVRFPTGLCLPLVATGLVLESPALLLALTGVAIIAGFTPRHPFDLIWNHGVRYLTGGPPLPPNPRRRRHAFKLGTGFLFAVSGLFLAGLTVAGLVLGGLLLAACTSATVLNFCVPSEALAWLERRRGGKVPIAT